MENLSVFYKKIISAKYKYVSIQFRPNKRMQLKHCKERRNLVVFSFRKDFTYLTDHHQITNIMCLQKWKAFAANN